MNLSADFFYLTTLFTKIQIMTMYIFVLQEEDAVTLGLSTGQALLKLRDQLSSLLEQHQRSAHRQASAQVCTRAFLQYVSLQFSTCLICPKLNLNYIIVRLFNPHQDKSTEKATVCVPHWPQSHLLGYFHNIFTGTVGE